MITSLFKLVLTSTDNTMKRISSTPYYLFFILLATFLYGCGAITADEVARMSFDKPTTSQEDLKIETASLDLKQEKRYTSGRKWIWNMKGAWDWNTSYS